MPMIHADRRENFGGALAAFEDDLPLLVRAGIGSVVSLLNIPSDAAVYASAGLGYLCLPIPDGYAPSLEQMLEFLRFEREQHGMGRVVAVHCAAGLGRTGTVLAGYLIAGGNSVESAIVHIRAVRRGAIETSEQVRFLHDLPAALGSADLHAS
jgi:atypical dual specificity phosphatase